MAGMTRMGWWRYPDDPYRSKYLRGVQFAEIDLVTMRPRQPLLANQDHTIGEFLGWVDNELNRADGVEVIPHPLEWRIRHSDSKA